MDGGIVTIVFDAHRFGGCDVHMAQNQEPHKLAVWIMPSLVRHGRGGTVGIDQCVPTR